MIYYIMGKSACGKDTVYRKVREDYPELAPIVLYTTRPMRAGEQDGVTYHFIDRDQLRAFEEAGKIETSDATFTRLQDATRRSYLSNFVGIPTDCPHREKNGWTGDAAFSCFLSFLRCQVRRHTTAGMYDPHRNPFQPH